MHPSVCEAAKKALLQNPAVERQCELMLMLVFQVKSGAMQDSLGDSCRSIGYRRVCFDTHVRRQ